jgi:PAS domain S-box-containing protein
VRFETNGILASPRDMMLAIDDLATAGAAPERASYPAGIEMDSGREDFLRLAEVSSAMIWMADNGGLCTFANPSWLEFRGRTLEQELGSGWAEGIHPDDALEALKIYWTAFHLRTPLRIEYRILGADAAYHPVERLGHPWFNAAGEIRGYVGSVCLIAGQAANFEARRSLAILSHRERQVMELIGLGYSTRQIAQKLSVSYKTADSHRTHLLKKLGLHEVASLVRFAIRAGVIVP